MGDGWVDVRGRLESRTTGPYHVATVDRGDIQAALGRVAELEEREKVLKAGCDAEYHMRTVDLPMWRERTKKAEARMAELGKLLRYADVAIKDLVDVIERDLGDPGVARPEVHQGDEWRARLTAANVIE